MDAIFGILVVGLLVLILLRLMHKHPIEINVYVQSGGEEPKVVSEP